jgi:hypothetical protein
LLLLGAAPLFPLAQPLLALGRLAPLRLGRNIQRTFQAAAVQQRQQQDRQPDSTHRS